MALKDIWKKLIDGESEISADDINDIADAVIEIEKNGSNIIVDKEMSDISENAVQNKVIKEYIDETKTELQTYLDEQILGGAW